MLNKTLIAAGLSVSLATALFVTGCSASNTSTASNDSTSSTGKYNGKKDALDGGMTYKRENGMYTAYNINDNDTQNVNNGRVPTANELKAWDTDIMPDGTGLPEGSGSVEEGDELYEEQCASCHGDFGAGGTGYPVLAGGTLESLKNQRTCPGNDAPKRTIGSYWPQASTLIWYIRDAMPYAHPKSLNNDELYALTAYMLSVNNIVIDGETLDDEYVLNREKFLKIKMPNRDGFIPDIDGPNGIENVRAFYADRKNYGAVGVRCMTDCLEEKVMRIGNEITNVVPAYSQLKDLPEKKAGGAISEAQELYEANCALCHKTDMMGAPAVGDHDAWNAVMEKGLDAVNANAINGTGGMPAKGGNMDLTDAQMHDILDYMITNSK